MDMELMSLGTFGSPKEPEKEYLTELEGGSDGAGEVWSELATKR